MQVALVMQLLDITLVVVVVQVPQVEPQQHPLLVMVVQEQPHLLLVHQ